MKLGVQLSELEQVEIKYKDMVVLNEVDEIKRIEREHNGESEKTGRRL